jgi:hypothetical protein
MLGVGFTAPKVVTRVARSAESYLAVHKIGMVSKDSLVLASELNIVQGPCRPYLSTYSNQRTGGEIEKLSGGPGRIASVTVLTRHKSHDFGPPIQRYCRYLCPIAHLLPFC